MVLMQDSATRASAAVTLTCLAGCWLYCQTPVRRVFQITRVSRIIFFIWYDLGLHHVGCVPKNWTILIEIEFACLVLPAGGILANSGERALPTRASGREREGGMSGGAWLWLPAHSLPAGATQCMHSGEKPPGRGEQLIRKRW